MEEKEIPLVRMWVSGEINKSRIAASITAFCCCFFFQKGENEFYK